MSFNDISLSSNTKNSNRISYTAAELQLCQQIGLGCLSGIGVIDPVDIPDDIMEVLQEEAENHTKAGPLCRAAHRKIEQSKFEKVDDETLKGLDKQNFPRPRDYTSVTLMFRKALQGMVDQEVIDQLFAKPKSYGVKRRKIV